jgi:hypothetical protein
LSLGDFQSGCGKITLAHLPRRASSGRSSISPTQFKIGE